MHLLIAALAMRLEMDHHIQQVMKIIRERERTSGFVNGRSLSRSQSVRIPQPLGLKQKPNGAVG